MVEEQLLCRNVKQFRGGLGFKAHRLAYHSTLGSRVIVKKKFGGLGSGEARIEGLVAAFEYGGWVWWLRNNYFEEM